MTERKTGRPPTGRHSIIIRLLPDEESLLRKLAKSLGIPLGKAVGVVLNEYEKRKR